MQTEEQKKLIDQYCNGEITGEEFTAAIDKNTNMESTAEQMKHQAYQTPKEDLMNSALEHYEEASAAIHHWNSDIPKAIRHYYIGDQKLNKKGLVSLGVCIGLVVGVLLGYVC